MKKEGTESRGFKSRCETLAKKKARRQRKLKSFHCNILVKINNCLPG